MSIKALKSSAVLESNNPGVLVSIKLSSDLVSAIHSDSCGIVDINCKNLFNKLLSIEKKKKLQENGRAIAPHTIESVQSASLESKLVANRMPISNRYDNIIDQLEKKYYKPSILEEGNGSEDGIDGEHSDVSTGDGSEEDNEESDDDDEEDDDDEGDRDLEDLAPSKKKKGTEGLDKDEGSGDAKALKGKNKKKRKRSMDDYDRDDPFVDDADAEMEVEAVLRTRTTKTKHDGFFVSAGQLEIMSPPRKGATSSSTGGGAGGANVTNKGKRSGAAGTGATKSTTTTASSSAAINTVAVKKKTNPSSKEGGKQVIAAAAAGVAATAGGGSGGGGGEGTSVPAAALQSKKVKKKVTPELLSDNNKHTNMSTSTSNDSSSSSSIQACNSATATNASSSAPNEGGQGGGGGEVQETPADSATSAGGATSAAMDLPTPAKATRVAKPKTPWNPSAHIAEAVEQFKEQFRESGVKLSKTSQIGRVVEELLHVLDEKVCKDVLVSNAAAAAAALDPSVSASTVVSKELIELASHALKDTDYYDKLQETLGGLIPAGKVRNALLKGRFRRAAAAVLKELDAQLESLCQQLKEGISPCPDNMQPAAKKKAATAKKVSTTATTTTGVAGALPSNDTDNGNSGNTCSGSGADMDTVDPATAAPSAASTTVVAAAAAAAAAAEDGKEGEEQGQPVVLIQYEWVCKWTPAARTALAHLERLVKQWVELENLYREKLTSLEKKQLKLHNPPPQSSSSSSSSAAAGAEGAQEELLVEKEQIQQYFQQICTRSFPEPPSSSSSSSSLCLNGDLAYLRKVLANERLKNKQKEKKKEQQVAAPSSVALSATSKTSSTGAHKPKVPVAAPAAPAVAKSATTVATTSLATTGPVNDETVVE